MGFLWTLVFYIFAIWMVYDLIVNQKKMDNVHKILWIIGGLIPAINFIVVIVYYFLIIRK